MTGVPLADEAQSWPVTESVDLHRDDWVMAFRADTVQRPDHPEDSFRRLVLEAPGAVMVLAVDDDEQVVVLRQYRHPVSARLVEIPAGLLDVDGEDAVLAAQRELREEAALQAAHWAHLVTVYPSPGISDEKHMIYLATGLSEADRGDFELEHEEAEMSVERVPMHELVEAVLDGRVQDAPLVTAVLAYDVIRRRSAGQIRGQTLGQSLGRSE
ncbi:MAG: NUDIX hydrolase [Actinomycetota bacterium]|nr:NUDIX hydrolase [Actinomycetota bacterium]